MSQILKASNITKQFIIGDGNTVDALKGVNIEANEGQLVGLKGRSGSGKTTLLNILGALDRPTIGEVYFGETELCKLSDIKRDKIRRKEMAFVFQSVALISTMTAYENVEFALRLAGTPMLERSKRAKECLARVGLEKRMHHRPGELSGGEQQRVAIARAISHKPKLIFADEPTAELDSETGIAVVKLFKDLTKEDKMTFVMTTHDETMMELADTVYILEDGVITA